MKSKVSTTLLPAALLACCLLHVASAQQPRITLVERNVASGAQANAQPSVVHKQVQGQPDRVAYRFSQQVHVGSPVTEVLEIAFTQPTTPRTIEANNDFKVASSSCQIGRTYAAGESCQVSVTLDPKGPGNRAGLLTFTSNESATADIVGLQGQTLGSVMSFIPAQITTVPQTLPSGKALLNNPRDVVTDQGDNLYISDLYPGSNAGGLVYFMDSSNVMTTLIGGGTTSPTGTPIPNAQVKLSNPYGLAVDPFLDLYTTDINNNALYETARGTTSAIAGLGATPAQDCTISSPCTPSATELLFPQWVNVDNNENIYLTDDFAYYTIPWQGKLSALSTTGPLLIDAAFGLDSADNLYAVDQSSLHNPADCVIDGVMPTTGFTWDALGSGICGSAGNNVRSQNAEVSSTITGYAFDAAGDMYVADYGNDVIRRVDSYNGLIRTVAGIGAVAGYSGDNGPATSASLDKPMGVAVDSYGNTYTASVDTSFSSAPNYVVRKVGPVGDLQFPVVLVGQTSPVQTVLITNTGNDDLMVSNEIWGGANPGDFIADPATTSCVWAEGLLPARSCQLGFSCKPTAGGWRNASITFVDNTAGFQNQLLLSCYGLASPATTTITINPPTPGSTFIAGSLIGLDAYVHSGIPAPLNQPTGTVNYTIINTATLATAATFNNDVLVPQPGSNQSRSGVEHWSNPPVGAYSLTVTYPGDTYNGPATSAAVPFTVVQVTPTVTITVPTTGSQFLPASPVTATVQVSNAGLLPTAPSPTGTLTITLTNTGTLAKTTFNPTMPAGTSGVTVTNQLLGTLAVGNYSLSASYSGDTADKAASATAVTFSVVQVTPTVTITSPVNGSQNLPGSMNATVKVSNFGLVPTAPAPTGTLSLVLTNTGTNAQTPIGPVTMPAGSSGVTTTNIGLGSLAVGNYSLSASYSGDADDKAANATTITFSVVQIQPTIVITSPQATSYSYLASLTYSAQLSNANLTPADPSWPTGTVTFTLTNVGTNAQTTFGPYTIGAGASNVVNVSVPTSQTPGANATYTLKASYSGDTDDKPATSAPVQFSMGSAPSKPALTSTTISAAHNPAIPGEAIELNATVNSSSSAMPTGWVTLWEGGKLLTSAALNGGKGSLKITNLTPGTHSLVATYSGDALNGTSNSAPFKQVVSGGNIFAHDPVGKIH